MAAFTVRLLTALVLLLPGSAAAAAGTDPLRRALDGLVAAGAPGALLLDRDGRHTARLTSGVADLATGRPARITDRFRAASLMKSYTAVVVLQLVQERRLGLDDAVDRLLPGVIPHGYGRGVTVRHLLQNTSGLFNFNDDPRVLAPYLAGDLGHVWTPQQLLDIAFEHPPLYRPGTGFNYSDTNFFLAAYIVEAVTGRSFDHELRARILRPLRLTGTDLPRTADIWGPHLHGYFPLGDPPVATDLTYLYPWAWAAGGLTSTVTDTARFYRALFGGELLGPRLMREMMTNTVPDPDTDLPSSSGLGVQRWTPCGVAWGHSGNVAGYLVYAWISPDTRRQTVLAINGDPQLLGAAGMAVYNDVLIRAFCGRRSP
ncbi:serine hydrolase domain-containing protein [Actinoplanes aureus]|uniref:Beta-lactamase family protein n=1 Tax=Actinoplanes aureus TaxID=2792083 RepID=A0A931CC09_9ACTN|nr:serine hydrolase domain-containing protein [Actinoplanes aureus]MBG0564576.1 beta-lactamase family protein [Actinoplanes aureus]